MQRQGRAKCEWGGCPASDEGGSDFLDFEDVLVPDNQSQMPPTGLSTVVGQQRAQAQKRSFIGRPVSSLVIMVYISLAGDQGK